MKSFQSVLHWTKNGPNFRWTKNMKSFQSVLHWTQNGPNFRGTKNMKSFQSVSLRHKHTFQQKCKNDQFVDHFSTNFFGEQKPLMLPPKISDWQIQKKISDRFRQKW